MYADIIRATTKELEDREVELIELLPKTHNPVQLAALRRERAHVYFELEERRRELELSNRLAHRSVVRATIKG